MAALGAAFIVLRTVSVVQAAQIFYGEPEPLVKGSVRSFVALDDNGNPTEIGATFPKETLSLPTGDTEPDIATELSLPPEASSTAFNHMELLYRPNDYSGLVPKGIGVPRFSLNFFLISPSERALICPHPDKIGTLPVCTASEEAPALKTPQPGTVPLGILQTLGGAEPGYGSRYRDPDTTTLLDSGQPFTSTYYYAFFDGKLTDIDFSSSIAFLSTQPNVTLPIKLPTSYSKSGYYPTEYNITYDAASQEYSMAFGGLTYRDAAESVPEPDSTWGLLVLGAWFTAFQVKRQRQNKRKQQFSSTHCGSVNNN